MPKRFRDDTIEDSYVSELVGLPTRKKSPATPKVNIDPMSFGGDVGAFHTKASIKTAQEGMKLGDLVGINGAKKKKTGLSSVSTPTEAVDDATGIPGFKVTQGRRLSPSVRKEIKAGAGSEISEEQRRSKGLGEFAGGGGGGGSFGLPSDRLPTIDELGGALGGIAKYVSQLSKRNRARGLVPGTAITKTTDKGAVGMEKAKLTTITKMYETAVLSGNKEEAALRKSQLDAIIQGDNAGAFADKDDLEVIAGL